MVARTVDTTKLGPAPECLDDDEWQGILQQARYADPWVRPHNFTRDYVLRRVCEDCTLAYQFLAKARGKCHPPEGASTPIVRAEAGVDDLMDAPLKLAVQRA